MLIITGGAGFIGSNLIYELNRIKEKNIIICDVLNSKLKKNYLKKLSYKKIVPPIKIFNFLEKNKEKIRYIFHLGAISATTSSNFSKLIKNNLEFPIKILKFCNLNKIDLIYASSASTYGNGKNGFNDNDNLHYLNKLKPLNLYGKSKNLFDLHVSKKIKKKSELSIQCVGLKFFNVYGKNEKHKKKQMSIISSLSSIIKKKGKVKLFKSHNKNFKDGEQKRDFIHVSDCINVILWFYKKNRISGLFNVGTGDARTFIDVTKILYKELKIKENISFIDTPKNIRKHYQYYTKANIAKLRKYGYKKKFQNIEDGIKLFIKENKEF
ncbi:MAG: ADP-L-glycero-D-manno-heptose-6-epimerase [Alphaproteobacteria bacterium MarineAlpha6_Bin5]|nr:MAG: ADP-L-glycero-D-manno-heptose-6-epimerase [Alphaproteobacteria bacterium MarineAlpha6_Bin5]|tara:strand:+ start:8954 stop:9925 length:972 start_codon:yes stop_codon:yes gene_type:complete